jgi:hypothetical protein
VLQWLRLWAWLEISLVLLKLDFNRIVLAAAAGTVPFGRDTFVAALFALELFPAFVGLLRPWQKADKSRLIIRDPAGKTAASIGKLYGDILRLVGGSGRQGTG